MALGSAALMFRVEGHGVNGSTSVSKTESLGSNPSAPAKPSVPESANGWLERLVLAGLMAGKF